MTGSINFSKDAGLGVITIDNPGKMNAVTQEMLIQLKMILDGLVDDEDVRVVLFRAIGDDFCSGIETGGLSTTTQMTAKQRAEGFEAGMTERIGPIIQAFLALRQPVVSSVQGYTIALGMSFALASDLIVASRSAKFILPQVRLGHTLDHGESWLLPRRIGIARAMQLTLIGETLSGDDAERFGLVNWLTPDEDLENRTKAITDKLLRLPPIALQQSKILLNLSPQNNLIDQLQAEIQAVVKCVASDDFVEAMNAFQEKRQGIYHGR